MRCIICNNNSIDKLCNKHSLMFVYDKTINGFYLKKRGRGSRYTDKKYHKTETQLAKIICDIFGKSNVVTSFYPMWAVSDKKVLYEYDIFVKNKKLLIGYLGEIHYKQIKYFHKKKVDFENQIKRDKIKRILADANNYNFVEFGYDEPILYDYVYRKLIKFL